MKKKSNNSNFWISYSDLMTALFFLMLLLFVIVAGRKNGVSHQKYASLLSDRDSLKSQLSKYIDIQEKVLEYSTLKDDNERLSQELSRCKDKLNDANDETAELRGEYNASQKELQHIHDIEASTKGLNSKYFQYNEQTKKHQLTIDVNFESNKYDIPQNKEAGLRTAGYMLRKFMKEKNLELGADYLLIIEGQASNDGKKLDYYNNVLSYRRALSLKKFWKSIDFGSNCEIIVSGSGSHGSKTSNLEERRKNQRFIITLVPKPGKLN